MQLNRCLTASPSNVDLIDMHHVSGRYCALAIDPVHTVEAERLSVDPGPHEEQGSFDGVLVDLTVAELDDATPRLCFESCPARKLGLVS
jgi:hypothetical protein